jgi:L-alanine-DL-glutamate epimerase-like enolase superfamily enzyme
MKVIGVDVIPVALRLASRYDDPQARIRMHDIDQHIVVRVRTDTGLIGYGDEEDDASPIPEEMIAGVVGRSPFDFINSDLRMSLAMALYDVMGKHLGVPVYKLMGQKVRDAVPAAAWTRPCPPDVFREEVRRAAAEGYRVFKMHSSPLYDVIEQTRAAEEVAPPGFRLHWDLNRTRTLGVVLPIVEELQHHAIVGFIEDPLPWDDLDGWRSLRSRTRIPLVMHIPPLAVAQGSVLAAADLHMIGAHGIGRAMRQGYAYAAANKQVIIQQTGNTLMKALTLHQAAVLPTATAHTVTADDQYEEDITTERIPIINGASPVPERPGLGYDVDEDALARVAANKPTVVPRHVGILHLPNGQKLYTLSFPSVSRITGREEGATRGINFKLWDDDGSEEFAQIHEQVQREGVVPIV